MTLPELRLSEIQQAIADTVASVCEIEAVYQYPVTELGRLLPALVIVYDSCRLKRMSGTRFDVIYKFTFTLFMPAGGKRVESFWSEMMTVAPKLIMAFVLNDTLNGTCRESEMLHGHSIVDLPAPGATVHYVGHSFTLEAHEDTDP